MGLFHNDPKPCYHVNISNLDPLSNDGQTTESAVPPALSITVVQFWQSYVEVMGLYWWKKCCQYSSYKILTLKYSDDFQLRSIVVTICQSRRTSIWIASQSLRKFSISKKWCRFFVTNENTAEKRQRYSATQKTIVVVRHTKYHTIL